MKTYLKAYIELIRYPLFAIPLVATLPGALIASDGQLNWRVGLALMTALLGYFAGMMKNDYFHREQDAIVNPYRPIPSHCLTPKGVLITASSIYVVCLILGFTLHIKAGLLVIALVMISHVYNAIFKGRGIWGSISLPVGIGLLNVFGALAVSGHVPRLVWYAFGATALYDFGNHITSTFKDIERDKKVGVITTPLQIGISPALVISASATILSFIIAVLPHWLEGVSGHYTLWIGFAMIATGITRLPLYLDPNEKNGYLALKGSMIGAITFFPCLIGVQISLWQSALVILPLLFVTMTLLEVTKREV